MERSESPNQEECCGNNCNPCIFDVHRKSIEYRKRNGDIHMYEIKNILKPSSYMVFYLDSINHVNPEYCLIWLKCKISIDGEAIVLKPGQYIMMNIFKLTRSFTPISWTNNSMQLLIRIYRNSPFTQNLTNLNNGEAIQIRGPYGDFEYSRNSFKKIFMFGIGSGIAVFYPIVKAITEDEWDETKVDMIFGFRSVGLIPLKKELQLLTDFWNISCTVQLTQLDKNTTVSGINLKHGKISEKVVQKMLNTEKSGEILILVCGNKNFNSFFKNYLIKGNWNNYNIFE